MNRKTKKTFRFAARSLGLSLLLFALAMSLFNWAELRSAFKGQYVVISSSSDTTLYRIGPAGINTLQKLLGRPQSLLKAF